MYNSIEERQRAMERRLKIEKEVEDNSNPLTDEQKKKKKLMMDRLINSRKTGMIGQY